MNAQANHHSPYPSAHIEYSFKMHVSHDTPLPLQVTHPRVKEATLRKKKPEEQLDSEWLMTIHFGPVCSMDQVKEIGNMIKDDILDILSFTLKTKIEEVTMVGSGLAPRSGERGIVHALFPFSWKIDAHGQAGTSKLSDDNIREIRDALSQIPNGRPRYLIRLFRYSINADDPVVQFLFLYLILYQLYENQDQVDKSIMNIAPNTLSSTKPKEAHQAKSLSKGKPAKNKETIFTRLRNEIAHGREVDLEVTRREIITHLDEFRAIVHTALKSMI